METNPLPQNDKAVGIDLGLEHFAALKSWDAKTGEEKQEQSIENPRFFRKEEKELAKAQRKLAKEEKGTPERNKRKNIVSKIHERIRNKRADFCHKQTRKLIDTYQYICLEDLKVKKMIEEAPRSLAKSIADASWNQFCRCLTYKAEEAGRKLGWVDPRGTSQVCSRCQTIVPKSLSQRRHDCPHCGYSTHRDFNSSEEILARGLAGLGICPRSPSPLGDRE
jgi:putative transposase